MGESNEMVSSPLEITARMLYSARNFSISLLRVINRHVSGRSFHAWNQNEKPDSSRTRVWSLSDISLEQSSSRKPAVWKHLGLTLRAKVTVKEGVYPRIIKIHFHGEVWCRPSRSLRMSEKCRTPVLTVGRQHQAAIVDAAPGNTL